MAYYRRTISSDMHLAYLRQGVGREMAGYSHTPFSCLSKLRSSIEAGRKQLRVWLQYVNRVAEVLLYSSFDAPLVLLWCSFGNTGDARYIHGGCTDVPRWCDGGLTLVFQRCNGDLKVISRMFHGDLTEMYALGNVCSCAKESRFEDSQNYVHRTNNSSLFSEASNISAYHSNI